MHGTVAADSLTSCRSFKIARVWMPVNIIFVGMIWTSFFALKNLGVPMATVLKNVTNLFTIVGDYLLYGKVRQYSVYFPHVPLKCLIGVQPPVSEGPAEFNAPPVVQGLAVDTNPTPRRADIWDAQAAAL